MADLNAVLRVMGEKKNPSTSIIETIIIAQPLTARQIYFKLKKRYGYIASYQAVHKRLQQLEKDEVLRKEQKEYSLNNSWLDQIDEFTTRVREKLKQRERVLLQLQRRDVVFEKKKSRIKVISLDLTGALFDNRFDELLWRSEIPRRYAEQYNISKEEAFERVTKEYRRFWGKTKGWRDPEFWLNHFKLNATFEDIITALKKEIVPYSDVLPALKKLAEHYHLIIISHAQENLMGQKLRVTGCEKYFLRAYSTSSDFNKMARDADVYREVCEELDVNPEEVVHLGDDLDFDYKIPSSIGVNAFLIDRRGFRKEPFVVRDLYEFEERVKELEELE